jgi:hypothetical protein
MQPFRAGQAASPLLAANLRRVSLPLMGGCISERLLNQYA